MQFKELLQQKLLELPEQIWILQEVYQGMADEHERAKKLRDLVAYEKRMRKGFAFLLSLPEDELRFIESIRLPSTDLLLENRERYLSALRHFRQSSGQVISNEQRKDCIQKLRTIPLLHTSNDVDLVRKDGILPASDLWLTPFKSCANPMDIALGLDHYVFLTHGFGLSNFPGEQVRIDPTIIDLPDTFVSTVDIFKLVLMHTGKTMPCAIETEEWLPVLDAYRKQLFTGQDFWRLKAEYILSFFSNIDEYHQFAAKHFYENFSEHAPGVELPFLGEVKVRGKIENKRMV